MTEQQIHIIQKQITELAKVQAEANKLQAEALEDLKITIKPMVDVYETFSSLGRWGTKLLKALILILTFVSLVLGIIWTIKKGAQ